MYIIEYKYCKIGGYRMLINYSFSNFRSFKNITSLSMRASAQRTLNKNLIKHDDSRVIPSTVIYGANASGKSNIAREIPPGKPPESPRRGLSFSALKH